MERKIGEVFTFGGRQIKVFKQNYRGIDKCFGCFFNYTTCTAPACVGDCRAAYRTDRKDVIFCATLYKM